MSSFNQYRKSLFFHFQGYCLDYSVLLFNPGDYLQNIVYNQRIIFSSRKLKSEEYIYVTSSKVLDMQGLGRSRKLQQSRNWKKRKTVTETDSERKNERQELGSLFEQKLIATARGKPLKHLLAKTVMMPDLCLFKFNQCIFCSRCGIQQLVLLQTSTNGFFP